MLEHDGRGNDGFLAVVAASAVADAVAVDFVHDVEGPVDVSEGGGVDGTAVVAGTGEGGVVGDVWS